MKKLFFCVAMIAALMLTACGGKSDNQSYADLGLPSGTKWALTNEPGFYSYDDAVAKYGRALPTEDQIKELVNYCVWKWNGSGYQVTGPNGKMIFLPADVILDGIDGYGGELWSSTPSKSNDAFDVSFTHDRVKIDDDARWIQMSVRLVRR